MTNSRAFLLLLPLLLPCARVQAQMTPGPEVVYGEDDRRDLYDVKDPRLLKLAQSTLALFESYQVRSEAGAVKLSVGSYGASHNLCREEPFWEQPSGAFCSGSLVAEDLIMTAGHCVTSQANCEDIKFVFGFGLPHVGADPTTVPAADVYGCKTLVGREMAPGAGADWALVRLDRPVTGRKPLELESSAPIAEGEPLVVIGHPAGLPTKVAGGATVRDASPKSFFVANLDTYGGNSGSAVFSARTGKVVGILVRGEQDYEPKGQCRVSKTCAPNGCRGEDVTKLSAVGFPREAAAASGSQARWAPVGESLSSTLQREAGKLSRQ